MQDISFEVKAGETVALVGRSGSGKSTFWNELKENHPTEVDYYSLDAIRMDLYEGTYEECWKQSTEDKEFKQKANKIFVDMVKNGNSIYLDNTNTSKKGRRMFIEEAKRHGYRIHAVLFPVALQTVIDRQQTREDKTVPEEAVKRQYMGIHLPQMGEIDSVIILDNNLV